MYIYLRQRTGPLKNSTHHQEIRLVSRSLVAGAASGVPGVFTGAWTRPILSELLLLHPSAASALPAEAPAINEGAVAAAWRTERLGTAGGARLLCSAVNPV